MEVKQKKKATFISFDWDVFDTSSSKTEDSKESYGFSFSDLGSEDDNYDGGEMYTRICADKQLQNSYSSTTTRAKTKISEEAESVKPKKKGRKKKKTPGLKSQLDSIEKAKPIKADSEAEGTALEGETAEVDPNSKPPKRKKKFKNKYVKLWKSKYEKFYKNKK